MYGYDGVKGIRKVGDETLFIERMKYSTGAHGQDLKSDRSWINNDDRQTLTDSVQR